MTEEKTEEIYERTAMHKAGGPYSLLNPKTRKRVSFDKAIANSKDEEAALKKEGFECCHPLNLKKGS